MIQIFVVLIGVMIAAWFDCKIGKIPNWLTFSLLLLGLALNGYLEGVAGLKQSFFGLVLAILFLYFPFKVGGVGGGDVKLLAGIGSLLGPVLVFEVFLASAVFGGVFSLAAMVKAKAVRNTFHGIFNRVFCLLTTRSVVTEELSTGHKALRIPYACAIACGTLFVLFVVKGG